MSDAGQELAEKMCVPCRGGIPPLTEEERAPLLAGVPEWEVIDDHHLARDFRFDSFVEALEFTRKAGAIAEEQGHHPEITVGWGHALVAIWTHKINGLTESDFILAAKIDRIPRP
jgi:4a-hydroxytetrahydrobiopterin dehydratase